MSVDSINPREFPSAHGHAHRDSVRERGDRERERERREEDVHAPSSSEKEKPHKKNTLKRITSKIFRKHKEHSDSSRKKAVEAAEMPSSSSTSSSSSSSHSSHSHSSHSHSHRERSSSTTSSSTSSSSSSSSRRPARSMSTYVPTRRASIQGRKNLMAAALPQSGPERKRAALALLAELEKYDHLQRRSMLRNLPPLQFHITVEKRVDGRIQETDIEVSMEELRSQLHEIIRNERGNVDPHPETPLPRIESSGGGLRQIKSTSPNRGVKDVSVFPTHIYDGRPLPETKSTCTICIEEYKKGDDIKTLPCLHFYHSECIDEWLKRSKCCPMCNAPVVETLKKAKE